MPNRFTHATAGTVSGAIAIAVTPQYYENIYGKWYLAGGIVGGYIGGILPDIIDPPITPHHRSIGHSVTVNSIGLTTLGSFVMDIDSWIFDRITITEENGQSILVILLQLLSGLVRGFIAGQASHLLLGSTTPKSLPI